MEELRDLLFELIEAEDDREVLASHWATVGYLNCMADNGIEDETIIDQIRKELQDV